MVDVTPGPDQTTTVFSTAGSKATETPTTPPTTTSATVPQP